jgi:hypothetical protein
MSQDPNAGPFDLDDGREEEPRPRRRRNRPEDEPGRPAIDAGTLFAFLKWGAFGVGCLLIAAALSQAAPWAAAFAGMACFAGIAARLAQAEELHYRK